MGSYNLDEKTGLFGIFGGIKNVTKLVAVNHSIAVKHFNMYDYINANVTYVSENTLKIQALNEIYDFEIFPGDYVVLNYMSSDELYVLSGYILIVHSFNPLILSIKIEKIEKMKDLRKNERYYVSHVALLKIVDIPDLVFSVVKNISVGGIKINCKEEMNMQEAVGVTVLLDKNSKLSFKGKIVRKNVFMSYFEYGIELLEINESNLKSLHRYLNDMQMGRIT